MESFSPTIEDRERNIPSFHRMKRLRDRYLFVTEQGGWVVMNNKERQRFLREESTQEEFDILKHKGMIITPRTIDHFVERAEKRYLFLDFGVTLHIIVPTLRCNHKCIYCHSSAEPEANIGKQMTKETADKIIEFIFQSPSPMIKIEFQGGEPLLRFDLFKYIVTQSKLKNANQEIAFEKQSEIDFDYVDSLLDDFMKDI